MRARNPYVWIALALALYLVARVPIKPRPLPVQTPASDTPGLYIPPMRSA